MPSRCAYLNCDASHPHMDGEFVSSHQSEDDCGKEKITNPSCNFLHACIESNEMAVYEMLKNDELTSEEVNRRDSSGKTGLGHAAANCCVGILECIVDLPYVDVNLADNEGNTPLIFAAQAGHTNIASYLLNFFRDTDIDQTNNGGFTALMKAAIQGRCRTAKLLLLAGASMSQKDNVRHFCAEDWAKFCGRHNCCDLIAKYRKQTSHFKSRFLFGTDKEKQRKRSNSEPNLTKKLFQNQNEHQQGWFRRRINSLFHSDRRIKVKANDSIANAIRFASTPVLADFHLPCAPSHSSPEPHRHKLVVPQLNITHAYDRPRQHTKPSKHSKNLSTSAAS